MTAPVEISFKSPATGRGAGRSRAAGVGFALPGGASQSGRHGVAEKFFGDYERADADRVKKIEELL